MLFMKQKKRALEGVKILDFTQVYSGPYCTMLLADLGAEVVKVESIGIGDQSRNFAPIKDNVSGYFNYLNRNKRSITLNLKQESGKQAALDLAKWADVVIENFSAGTIAKLGLGYEKVKQVNPNVVFASLSGFGQYGPYKNRLAYDAIAEAMGGLTSLSGPPERSVKVTPAISDAITGIHMAFGVMIALFHRERTGEGQLVDVAMMDSVMSILEAAVMQRTLLGNDPKRLGNATESAVPYDMYPCKDGEIVLACASDSTFNKFCGVMGREDLCKDPLYYTNPVRIANREGIDKIIRDWCMERTKDEVIDACMTAKVPAAPVMTISDLVDDPHVAAREMLIELEDPTHGKVKYPGNPIKLSETPAQFRTRAPRLGEHTDEVLQSILGYSQEQIDALRGAGAIGEKICLNIEGES